MVKAKKEICNSFNKHAKNYEKVAIVQKEIGTRLLQRLDYLKFKPRRILDLGCGCGYFSVLLQNKYPDAEIFSLDIAFNMLKETSAKAENINMRLINADAGQLPIKTDSFDLIFANQVIHWIEPINQILAEILRVLKVNGLLLFSTLGPVSLIELKNAWALVDNHEHVQNFLDMHHIGDILQQELFKDPVVDMEYITVQYPDAMRLIKNIKNQGVRNISQKRKRGLTTKGELEKLMTALPKTEDGKYPLTYEVIYGHALKSELQKNNEASFITIEQIKKNFANI